LAHPFDPAAPDFGEDSLGWVDWDIHGFTGLEIWNFMSNFKGHLGNKVQTARAAFYPERVIVGPQPETLAKWDNLLTSGLKVTAVGNSDAHGLTYKMGPIARKIFPYEFLFKAINTHILLDEELAGDLETDKKLVLSAIGNGNCWVAYDLPASTDGFRFSGQSKTKGIMGDTILLESGATLQVIAPGNCSIRLIGDGEVVAEGHNIVNLTHYPTSPGAFRAECYVNYIGMERGWIFSNPIYIET
jgi:hypothetical protein